MLRIPDGWTLRILNAKMLRIPDGWTLRILNAKMLGAAVLSALTLPCFLTMFCSLIIFCSLTMSRSRVCGHR